MARVSFSGEPNRRHSAAGSTALDRGTLRSSSLTGAGTPPSVQTFQSSLPGPNCTTVPAGYNGKILRAFSSAVVLPVAGSKTSRTAIITCVARNFASRWSLSWIDVSGATDSSRSSPPYTIIIPFGSVIALGYHR